MKKINKALSNEVFLKDENIIVKRYLYNDFKDIFGNQEEKVLSNIGREYSIEDDAITMKYIKHQPFNDKKINNEIIVMVADALKSFWKNDINDIEISGFVNFKDDFEDDPELFEKAIKILKSGQQVLLHNDVVEGNLLITDNKIELIDFEYSGIGNKIFDIASFTTERSLSPEQRKFFISQFDDLNINDLEIVENFLQLFWSKWAKEQYDITGKKIYNDIYKWKISKYKKEA